METENKQEIKTEKEKEETRRLKRIDYLKNYHKKPENKIKKSEYHKLYYMNDIVKEQRKIYQKKKVQKDIETQNINNIEKIYFLNI